MATATSPAQRETLTTRFRDDVASLVENIGELEKRATSKFPPDTPLEVTYFVACAHHLTALMTIGHDQMLLREVLASLDAYERKMVAQILKLIEWPWLGRGIAKRMVRVRRQQYLDGLSIDPSFVETSELAIPFVSRLIKSVKDQHLLGLSHELASEVEDYLTELYGFYQALFDPQSQR